MRTTHKRCQRNSHRGGFTLLEVLLVLIILGVIAAVVVPRLLGTQERANVNATRASIHGLAETLELYAVEHDATYPETLDSLLSPVDRNGNAMKPYLNEVPLDPWGQPLNYRTESDANTGQILVRIWSNGPNRQNEDGSGDDINNWDQTQQQTK